MVIVWFLGVLWLTFFFYSNTFWECVPQRSFYTKGSIYLWQTTLKETSRENRDSTTDHFCKWPINQLLLSIEINYHHGIPRRVFETGFSLFRVGRGLLHSFQTSRNSVNFNLFRQKPALLCNGNFITLFEQWDRRTPKGCNPAFYSFLFNSI